MPELSREEQSVMDTVREFVGRDVRPVVRDLEHTDTYPEHLVEQMRRLGVLGLAIPEPHGEVAVSTPRYVRATEQLARGWMSLAGAMGGHTVAATPIRDFGTEERRERYPPRMATGEVRATMALTEPAGRSDLRAITTTARRDGDGYVVNGTKTWNTNSRRAQVIAPLCKTGPDARPRHAGISVLLVEHGDGVTASRDLPKLDAPLMIVGEGTNETQRTIVAAQLVDRGTPA